jgi:hypothetical protein
VAQSRPQPTQLFTRVGLAVGAASPAFLGRARELSDHIPELDAPRRRRHSASCAVDCSEAGVVHAFSYAVGSAQSIAAIRETVKR